MGDRCPRANVSAPTENSTFKRSFDELGDLISSTGDRSNGSEGNSSSGERNKRPRSNINAGSSSLLSNDGPSSSTANPTRRTSEPAESGLLSTVHMSTEADNVYPPMEGIEPVPSIVNPSFRVSSPSQRNDHYRLSMERLNAFDSNVAMLRHSDSPIPGPSLPRSARPSLAASVTVQASSSERPSARSLNTVEHPRPSSPASSSTLTSRMSALPSFASALASESTPPSWRLDSPLTGDPSLRIILNACEDSAPSSSRVRNVPVDREQPTHSGRAHESREQSHGPHLSESLSQLTLRLVLTVQQRLSAGDCALSAPKKLYEGCAIYNNHLKNTCKEHLHHWNCRPPVSVTV